MPQRRITTGRGWRSLVSVFGRVPRMEASSPAGQVQDFASVEESRCPPQCQVMMAFTELAFVPSDSLAPFTDQLRLAVAGYLARFKGSFREHTESDLRCYLTWCAGRGLDPLTARRPHLELYIRWMLMVQLS